MPGESLYVITPADRATLLQGPPGAILMLGGDRTAGSLSLVVPRLAAAHGLRVPGAPPGTP